MTEEEWRRIKRFNPDKNWGDPHKMDYGFIFLLDKLSAHLNIPIIISRGYYVRVADKSPSRSDFYHSSGMACDLVFPQCDFTDTLLRVLKLWWFGGIGIHRSNGACELHLDAGDREAWWEDEIGVHRPISELLLPIAAIEKRPNLKRTPSF